jgi:hypothetical protein
MTGRSHGDCVIRVYIRRGRRDDRPSKCHRFSERQIPKLTSNWANCVPRVDKPKILFDTGRIWVLGCKLCQRQCEYYY